MGIGHRLTQTWRYALSRAADERHGLLTAEALRRMGADEELVSAGLLHDVAKPAGTRLWHRIAAVLLESAPGLRARLARGDGTLARYLDHPRRGAEEARRRGASERVARLIERHHEPALDADERALHAADREALP